MTEDLMERVGRVERTQYYQSSRLDILENLVSELYKGQKRVDEALVSLAKTQEETKKELKQLGLEFKDFKDEMRSFKDEMKAFKDEMKAFKDEMNVFKDEMKVFKDEMKAFKDEMKVFKDEMNKKWGDLARKMGTVVEDIVAPGFPYAVHEAFGLDVEDLIIRRKKKKQGKIREYDIIAVAGNYVFVVDVKNTYRAEYLTDFKDALDDFENFFPEYKDKKVVPVIASFNLDDQIINAATKRGILALKMGGEYLKFANLDKISLG